METVCALFLRRQLDPHDRRPPLLPQRLPNLLLCHYRLFPRQDRSHLPLPWLCHLPPQKGHKKVSETRCRYKNVKEEESNNNAPIYHAIIIPSYKEDSELLLETLNVLAKHQLARTTYIVMLAMEAHEEGSDKKAE